VTILLKLPFIKLHKRQHEDNRGRRTRHTKAAESIPFTDHAVYCVVRRQWPAGVGRRAARVAAADVASSLTRFSGEIERSRRRRRRRRRAKTENGAGFAEEMLTTSDDVGRPLAAAQPTIHEVTGADDIVVPTRRLRRSERLDNLYDHQLQQIVRRHAAFLYLKIWMPFTRFC